MKYVSVVCVIVCVLAGSEASAEPALLYFHSERGDYIGEGRDRTFTHRDLNFAVTRNANDVSFWITNSDLSIWWHLDFSAPFNAVLTPGAYDSAMRLPFQPAAASGLSFG